ncbi:hypothetical protein E4U42_004633 [Claviceps africana]|uniref:Uncharacterized protein n=1 Tax=Claviceps africana TaxID=83212 RepID=A0A8K0J5Y2_9HYPO|nr:hypothetical protein E4U42_004633 [Claviceps africana]
MPPTYPKVDWCDVIQEQKRRGQGKTIGTRPRCLPSTEHRKDARPVEDETSLFDLVPLNWQAKPTSYRPAVHQPPPVTIWHPQSLCATKAAAAAPVSRPAANKQESCRPIVYAVNGPVISTSQPMPAVSKDPRAILPEA